MPVVTLKELKARLPYGKRLLGIDHSQNNIGLALSNPDLTIATPLKTLKRTKLAADMAALAALAQEFEVGGFVIGLPLNMDGSTGGRVDSVKHFGVNMIAAKDVFGFEPLIAFQDERLSSFAAGDLLDGADISGKKRAQVIDAQAACGILQAALDSLLT